MSERNGLTMARGFTLIEVLMAAFIIALGVLGLSALFAGAARQQQVASQTTNSVMVSNNADAVLARNFGAIDAGEGAARAALQNNSLANAKKEVWYPIPTPNSATGTNYSKDNYLSVDAVDDGDVNGTLYFLVDEPQSTVLLDAPQGAAPSPAYHYTNSNLNVNPPNGVTVRSAGHGRLDPASLSEIRVIIGPSVTTGDQQLGALSFTYVPSDIFAPQVSNNTLADPYMDRSTAMTDWGTLQSDPAQPEDIAILFLNGDPNYSNYVVLNLGRRDAMNQVNYSNPLPARLVAVHVRDLAAFTNYQIRRIELGAHKWRNDRLISLEDRIVSREDSNAINGRRPDIGYSLLYRRFDTGAAQLGIFTYQLSAVDSRSLRPQSTVRAGEPLFVPKETLSDYADGTSSAPMRKVKNVGLNYDIDEQQYYIAVDPRAVASNWLIEPGQLLVVGSRGTNEDMAGADLPVRVVRKVKINDNEARGYLDRAPRAKGEAILLPSTTAVASVDITVWAIQETAKSRRENGTWKLTPLDFRVIQVR